MFKFACAAVCTLASSAALAESTIKWKDDVQGWSVAIDRTINDSCFISSGFGNDMYVRFQFNVVQQNVQFIVASVHWESVQAGADYDLELAFGEQDTWAGVAKGYRWGDILPSLVVSVPMANEQASLFMQDFSHNPSVTVRYEGSDIASLKLSGAEQAIEAMMACQEAVTKTRSSRNSVDPFAGAIAQGNDI